MAPKSTVIYRRAFLDRDAPMVLPVVPLTWALLGVVVFMDGRIPRAVSTPAALLEPSTLAWAAFNVVALVTGGALLVWYVLDGVPTVYAVSPHAVSRRNGGLFGRTRTVKLDQIEHVHVYPDPKMRSHPFLVDLVLRDGGRVRWALVNRKRRDRLDGLLGALSELLRVDETPSDGSPPVPERTGQGKNA